jgi:DoxX
MLKGIIPASQSGNLHAALRIMTGLLFLAHGSTKLLHWPATDYFPAGQALPPLMLIAGILELVGGILIVLGLFYCRSFRSFAQKSNRFLTSRSKPRSTGS